MFSLAISDIRLLKVFHCVAAEKGFAPAAARLGLSEAAVSRAMSDLEARIGLRLCTRGRGGFMLEPDGEFVLQAAQRLMNAMDDVSDQLRGYRLGMKGELRLAITESTLSDHKNRVSEHIARFKARAPDVRIELIVLPPSGVRASIRDGRAHVGFLPAHSRADDLDYHELHRERMSLYCSQGHPLFGRICNMEDICAAEIASPDYLLSDRLGVHGDKLRIVSRTNSIEGIGILVMTGSYLGFLPDHLALHWVQQGQLQELMPEVFSYHIRFCAIARSDRKDSRLIRSFLRELSGPGPELPDE
jgi:DNA-binding transcriptional LysR family regulator